MTPRRDGLRPIILDDHPHSSMPITTVALARGRGGNDDDKTTMRYLARGCWDNSIFIGCNNSDPTTWWGRSPGRLAVGPEAGCGQPANEQVLVEELQQCVSGRFLDDELARAHVDIRIESYLGHRFANLP